MINKCTDPNLILNQLLLYFYSLFALLDCTDRLTFQPLGCKPIISSK